MDTGELVVYIHYMKHPYDMTSAQKCICFSLRSATRVVTQFYDAEMRRHGIGSNQMSILASMMGKESWNMAELSDWLGMERTTLVRNLQPLERDGLVEIEGGGRGRQVTLTIKPKGREQIKKMEPAWMAAQSAAIDILGEERWTALLTDLERVSNALKK